MGNLQQGLKARIDENGKVSCQRALSTLPGLYALAELGKTGVWGLDRRKRGVFNAGRDRSPASVRGVLCQGFTPWQS